MGRWINYILVGVCLSVLIIIHPTEGLRANPGLMVRHRREVETASPVEIDLTAKDSNNTNADSNDSKNLKPATRNRGKIKYHTTLIVPKISEKPAIVKEIGEHKIIKSRQYRNISETTVTDAVTESIRSTTAQSKDETNIKEVPLRGSLADAIVKDPALIKKLASEFHEPEISENKNEQQVKESEVQPSVEESISQNVTVGNSSETIKQIVNEENSKENDTEIPSFDISKYISDEFRKKEYQLPSEEESTFMSLQVHDPIEAVKGIRPVNLFKFQDELTTPKTILFDEHHAALRDQIKSNLDAASGGVDSEATIDLDALAEKAKTDNNTKVHKLTVKELFTNEGAGEDGHIHKELISTNGTKIEYETSNLETNIKELEKEDDVSTENSHEENEAPAATEATSVVTAKVLQNNATEFVNNLDVKVREVFPDLSTSTPKIDMHAPVNVITIPVMDMSSNTTHPRLRISVKANKVSLNDSETTENIIARNSSRGQKSYFNSTPSAAQDSKNLNEIQQAQETVHGTTKTFRQLNTFSDNDAAKFMNLPDNVDAWSLIGMKHVPTQKRNITALTDTPINIKELVDWSEIMKNEGNSTDNATNTSTLKSVPTESQGEENKLIPVQVPAPTKTSTLIVENNIPSNDITTMKPEDVLAKNNAHRTPLQNVKDEGDNLRINRVDDFEIISPAPNIEKINITLKNAVAVNLTARPITISNTISVITPTMTMHKETIEEQGSENHKQPTLTTRPQKTVSKIHKQQMTIEEQKMETTVNLQNLTTQETPQTTSNILEVAASSTMPNIVMMSPEPTNHERKVPSSIPSEIFTTQEVPYETTSINEIVQVVTETSTIFSEEDSTTLMSNSPLSSEEMINDSPSIPTEIATTLSEDITTIVPEDSTETGNSLYTTPNTSEILVSETETTITETPLEYTSPDIDTITDVPFLNKSSSSIMNIPETTLASNSGVEESTHGNMIIKILNVTVMEKDESDLISPSVLTSYNQPQTTPDTLSSDDFIEEYTDNTEGSDVNVNTNSNNIDHNDENNSSTDDAVVPIEHETEAQTEKVDVPRHSPTASMENHSAENVPVLPATEQGSKNNIEITTNAPFTYEDTTTTTMISTTTTVAAGHGGVEENHEVPEEGSAVAAVTISIVGVIALIILASLVYIMRKRQSKRTYGQRCTPVSLDAYSVDSVSVYSSVRGKNRARASKRSYGNPAFNDSGMTSHSMSFPALSNFVSDESAVFAEFTEIPTVTVRADEVPAGCEVKNRYANVMPLPETRVPLNAKPGDELGSYINANYVRGPKGIRNYYIACQAPMQATVNDFWRMIWEQQTKVILMLTDLYENGVEKCTDYLPPSEVLDCHRLFGDFKVTLKKREVKDKYVISNVQLYNMESGTWREVTHLWYMWPEKGVPKEYQSMVAFLIEARSFMKSPHEKSENNNTSNQASKKDGTDNVNIYSPQQAQKAYRKTHRAPTEPPNSNGDAKKMSTGESSSRNAQNKTTTTSMCRLSTINEKSSNGSVSEPPTQYSTAPVVVHCSPGTGRTGAVIACDLAIKEFEVSRTVDIPKTVYRIRRDRASSVQTKEQYMFIYQVINLYATKLTGGVLDSI